jgi:hypothetical protein
MTRVREQIAVLSRHQPACLPRVAGRALRVGPLSSVVIRAEIGDTRRFRSTDDVVRHVGLDGLLLRAGAAPPMAGQRRAPGPGRTACAALSGRRPRSTPDGPACPTRRTEAGQIPPGRQLAVGSAGAATGE